MKTEGKFVAEVDVNSEATDIKIDFQKIITCALKYAPDIYPLIFKCFHEPNMNHCLLKLVQPATELYQCIFETEVAMPQTSQVSKYWSLSHFNYNYYINLGNLTVISCSRPYVSYISPKIISITVGSGISGTNGVRVYLISVTHEGSQPDWSASGSVVVVCK